MKKSFTLLELLISISIFMILVIFLYKTIEQTKYSNNNFSKKEQKLKEFNRLHNLFLEDIAEASNINISIDKEKNSIVRIITNNTYHNPYFNNITYFISPSKKLLRIESLEFFNEQEPLNISFFENSFIDVLQEDIEFFEAKNNNINYVFYIKEKNKDRKLFNMYKIIEKK